jgi:hypothetical protein
MAGGGGSPCGEKEVAAAAISIDHDGAPTAGVDRRPRGEGRCLRGVLEEEKKGRERKEVATGWWNFFNPGMVGVVVSGVVERGGR